MISYRPFTNRDPPALADIWRSCQAGVRAVRSLSPVALDELVLAKPYFDRQGLIVAVADGRPVGFAHAGFGPNPDESALSPTEGIVCLVRVRPEFWTSEVPAGLLARAEDYLRGRGATSVQVGGGGLPPFYLGLAGGSEVHGVHDSAGPWRELLVSAGYKETGHYRVLHRELDDFRPAVSRQQMLVRRRTTVDGPGQSATSTWWEDCTLGCFEPRRFSALPRGGGPPWASVLLWNMEAFSREWGVAAAGLLRLRTDPGQRRQGVATCLVGEALLKLRDEGCSLVEAQVATTDAASQRLFSVLGFQDSGGVTQFARQLSVASPA